MHLQYYSIDVAFIRPLKLSETAQNCQTFRKMFENFKHEIFAKNNKHLYLRIMLKTRWKDGLFIVTDTAKSNTNTPFTRWRWLDVCSMFAWSCKRSIKQQNFTQH